MAVVWVVMCFAALAWSIPRSNSDQHINSFWLSPKEKGRETVSMVTAQGNTVKCTFDYSTFPVEKKETEAKKELPPSEILAEYMATSPCLNFKNDHGYTLCIGKNATQNINGAKTESVLLGTFKDWTAQGEQAYEGGSGEHCTAPRTATVQFTCESGLRIASVSEPVTCKYHFVVGTPEACGHRVFERSAAVAGSETWYMEIFEAHDEAIGCVVHAAGFGQSSPIHSGVVTDFSLGLEKDKTALPIASFEARHGQRLSYGRQDVRVSEGVLKPRSLPLPALPNYLAITATTAA